MEAPSAAYVGTHGAVAKRDTKVRPSTASLAPRRSAAQGSDASGSCGSTAEVAVEMDKASGKGQESKGNLQSAAVTRVLARTGGECSRVARAVGAYKRMSRLPELGTEGGSHESAVSEVSYRALRRGSRPAALKMGDFKDTKMAEAQAPAEQIVTPWDVAGGSEGGIDYDRLVRQTNALL